MNGRPKYDHFTVACITFLAIAVLAAVVILVDTNHSADVRSAVVSLVSLAGSAATLAGIQSVRNGVGQTNESIENGVLKDKVKEAVDLALQERAANNPRERAGDNPATP